MLLNVYISFLCHITNYPRLSSLKQHPFITSQFLLIRSSGGTTQLGCLLRVSQDCELGIGWAVFLSGSWSPVPLVQFSSLQLWDEVLHLLVGCKMGAALSFQRPLQFLLVQPFYMPFHGAGHFFKASSRISPFSQLEWNLRQWNVVLGMPIPSTLPHNVSK